MEPNVKTKIEQRIPHHWAVRGPLRPYVWNDDYTKIVVVDLAEFSTRAEARRWLKKYKREVVNAKAP
jgi:hypothetical protein